MRKRETAPASCSACDFRLPAAAADCPPSAPFCFVIWSGLGAGVFPRFGWP